MKIYVSRINKNNVNDIFYFKYKGSKMMVSLAFFYEQMEPRYIMDKTSFLKLWKQYTGSNLDIVVEERLKPDVLLEYLTFFNSSKLEAFLEKIWLNYKFVILVK